MCPCTCARATVRLSICTPRPWGTRFMMWRLSIMRMEKMRMTWGSSLKGSSITTTIITTITTTTTTMSMAVGVVLGRSRGMPKPPDWMVNKKRNETLVWNSRLFWIVLCKLGVDFLGCVVSFLLESFCFAGLVNIDTPWLYDAWINNKIVAFRCLCLFCHGNLFYFHLRTFCVESS